MTATIDISMYPLTKDYETVIIDFIQQLKKYPEISIEVNGLSTQLFGDFAMLMDALKEEIESFFKANEHRAVFVVKLAQGEHRSENLPSTLR